MGGDTQNPDLLVELLGILGNMTLTDIPFSQVAYAYRMRSVCELLGNMALTDIPFSQIVVDYNMMTLLTPAYPLTYADVC
jgi:hypothetical protein